ncbi:class IIb bacteriocin, lactobin A/cerein 7B family [Streptococcus sp. Marseille-Q5986]|uniref:class IIb bacteriocin, lactobin A/cerein 7B family n=1 Tax=Streptococcus sp. Marseille-Q5986 TaxID=2972782 RepID=UPI0022640992|nr:class IIb bacteriocin, lactobin A/cerein 7B family [Streptococcus sp. Marseille-Q5986]
MENLNQFELMGQTELEQVQGGVGLLVLVGGSLLAAGGAGIAGYWLARTFG